jgi:hypothetical protein
MLKGQPLEKGEVVGLRSTIEVKQALKVSGRSQNAFRSAVKPPEFSGAYHHDVLRRSQQSFPNTVFSKYKALLSTFPPSLPQAIPNAALAVFPSFRLVGEEIPGPCTGLSMCWCWAVLCPKK